jgi:hypothetical protein
MFILQFIVVFLANTYTPHCGPADAAPAGGPPLSIFFLLGVFLQALYVSTEAKTKVVSYSTYYCI